jgi:hypothetical protein
MSRALSVTAVLSLALILAGCKDDFESLTSKLASKTEQAVDVLKGVKDKASADAAVTKLKALNEEVNELEKKLSALPQPKAEDMEKTLKAAEPSMKKATAAAMEMGKEAFRIQSAGLMTPELQSAINGTEKAGSKPKW